MRKQAQEMPVGESEYDRYSLTPEILRKMPIRDREYRAKQLREYIKSLGRNPNAHELNLLQKFSIPIDPEAIPRLKAQKLYDSPEEYAKRLAETKARLQGLARPFVDLSPMDAMLYPGLAGGALGASGAMLLGAKRPWLWGLGGGALGAGLGLAAERGLEYGLGPFVEKRSAMIPTPFTAGFYEACRARGITKQADIGELFGSARDSIMGALGGAKDYLGSGLSALKQKYDTMDTASATLAAGGLSGLGGYGAARMLGSENPMAWGLGAGALGGGAALMDKGYKGFVQGAKTDAADRIERKNVGDKARADELAELARVQKLQEGVKVIPDKTEYWGPRKKEIIEGTGNFAGMPQKLRDEFLAELVKNYEYDRQEQAKNKLPALLTALEAQRKGIADPTFARAMDEIIAKAKTREPNDQERLGAVRTLGRGRSSTPLPAGRFPRTEDFSTDERRKLEQDAADIVSRDTYRTAETSREAARYREEQGKSRDLLKGYRDLALAAGDVRLAKMLDAQQLGSQYREDELLRPPFIQGFVEEMSRRAKEDTKAGVPMGEVEEADNRRVDLERQWYSQNKKVTDAVAAQEAEADRKRVERLGGGPPKAKPVEKSQDVGAFFEDDEEQKPTGPDPRVTEAEPEVEKELREYLASEFKDPTKVRPEYKDKLRAEIRKMLRNR